MLYWECCLRAASELCPDGFVYKEYPAEYLGNFMPPSVQVEIDGSDLEPPIRWPPSAYVEIGGSDLEPPTRRSSPTHIVNYRSDLKPPTRWERKRLAQRRMAPPDLELGESDVSPTSHGIRNDKLEFMRETRRHAYEPWREDSSHRRYRTALDQICHGNLESIGIISFPQRWYSIVEAYTRSRLTFSTDTLIAIGGIVEKIQQAKKYRFVAGLWEEHMVECLLWFVVTESPSHRRQETKKGPAAQEPIRGAQMAPSWSWVSVDAAVTIDQLPVNANRGMSTTHLTTTCTATAQKVPKGPSGEDWNAVEGTLEVEAPLAKITQLKHVDGKWFVHIASISLGPDLRSVQIVPDLTTFDSLQGATGAEDLFCLSLLALQRKTEMPFHIGTSEVQGIVVRRLQSREGLPDLYERVGFFTRHILGGSWRL